MSNTSAQYTQVLVGDTSHQFDVDATWIQVSPKDARKEASTHATANVFILVGV